MGKTNDCSIYGDDLVECLPSNDRPAAAKAAAPVVSMAGAKTTERQAGILLLLLQPFEGDPDVKPDQTWVGDEELRGVDRRLWIVGRLVNRRLAMRRQDETGRYSYRLTASGILLARKIKKEAGL